MCGVFATTEPGRWSSLMPSVLAMLGRRGPDETNEVSPAPGLLFGHTRLEIIGLGKPGRQPLDSRDGRVTVAFNGEIYNYQELAARGGETQVSDTAVVADLLSRGETALLADLRGMFAFAAWDRVTGTLMAMRDPCGIKPLYVLHHASGGVTICSEIAPLLLDAESERLDDLGLANYLAMGHTGHTLTLFESIRKLVPGRLYRWTRRAGSWSMAVEAPVGASGGSAAALDEALEDSVRAHLVADVEVGAFLSGGVDSTLVTAVANRLSPGLRTFTLAFPESPSLDESAVAERNAALIGTKHVTVPVTQQEMARCSATFVREHGEPFGDAAALPLTHLARAAAQDVKVVLCGEGADEIFGGYKRYQVSRRLGRAAATAGLATSSLADTWALRRSGSARARAVEAALWGGGLRGHAALLDGDLPLVRRIRPDVHRDLIDVLRADWMALSAKDPLERAQVYDRMRWLPNVYLEKTDRATMSAGLEARVPFLDPAVIAAAAPLDRTDQRKAPLREMLSREAPAVTVPMRKRGLSVDAESMVLRYLNEPFRFELEESGSVLQRWAGRSGALLVSERARRSPTLAFRVAMLGVWEQEFRGERYTCN